jgi:xanthine dehydrogenase YagS FAD-binding subunit
MRPFEYARPDTEAEALEMLNDHGGNTAVLAGGTDLISLMKRELVTPDRVVDLKNVPSLSEIREEDGGVRIGSLVTLDEMQKHPLLNNYQSLRHVIDGIRAIQIQHMGTLGGDLCHLPNCWYFRSGYGLLAIERGVSLVEAGDNRYHAIFGNQGAAKFVSASRFAPGLVAWGARVEVIGPDPQQSESIPLEHFYITPKLSNQGVTVLKPGQLISHIWLPVARQQQSATYEVLQMEGLDWPLAAAASCVEIEGGVVQSAKIVMGHVAPTPIVATAAATILLGNALTVDAANLAADIAVSQATPLSNNGYKVQLARTAVKRSLLKAIGHPEGGI